MRKLFFLAVILFTGSIVLGQRQRLSPHDTVTTKNIKVTYGRPYKKGRVIFGEKEKYGQVWRTGADEATEITFDKDATFGGKPVKAGTYTLWTVPGEKEWDVILNSDSHFWGTQHEQHKDKDVLKVTVPVKKLDQVVEQHTIRFDKGNMIIEWDQSQVTVPVKVG